MVGDILRLSRIEDREIEPVWEDIELNGLCRATAEMLSEPASKHNVTIRVEGEEKHINGVEQIVTESGEPLDNHAPIRFREPTKAVLLNHKVTLVVLRGEGYWLPRPHRGRKG